MDDLGNAWHIPGSSEVDGFAGMRDPVDKLIIQGTEVRVISGNQFQGGGNAGEQKQGVSFVHYRYRPIGDWAKKELNLLCTIGNNKYYSATIPTNGSSYGGKIKYYLEIQYDDHHKPTFLYMHDDRSERTEDKAEAEGKPFIVGVSPWQPAIPRALFYLIIGLSSGLVALFDTFTAATVASQAGALLVAIAAASAVWAGCLLLRRAPSKWSGIGGAIAVTAIAVVYASSIWNEWLMEWPPIAVSVGVVLTVLLAICAGIVSWRKDRSALPAYPSQTATTRRVEVSVAIVALIGTLLAAALQVSGGWYTSTHTAIQLHPNLTMRIVISAPVALPDANTAVPVEIVIKNTGQLPVDLPITHYTAIGFRINSKAARPKIDTESVAADEDPFDFTRFVSAVASQECTAVLQFGRVIEAMTNLGPGEEKTRRLVVRLPDRSTISLDGLRLHVQAAATRDDDLRISDEEPTFYDSSGNQLMGALAPDQIMREDGGYAQWKIERSTLLSYLISPRRELRAGWKSKPVSNPADVCPTQPPLPSATQTMQPYVRFMYAKDEKQVGVAPRKNLDDRYDPFYVYAAVERLLGERDPEPSGSESASADRVGR